MIGRRLRVRLLSRDGRLDTGGKRGMDFVRGKLLFVIIFCHLFHIRGCIQGYRTTAVLSKVMSCLRPNGNRSDMLDTSLLFVFSRVAFAPTSN